MVGCIPPVGQKTLMMVMAVAHVTGQLLNVVLFVCIIFTVMPGDSIVADRGIMVQDLFASRDIFCQHSYNGERERDRELMSKVFYSRQEQIKKKEH